ncbi:MAG: M20/M25/M40 family metallo-hydrolase [Planctomycetes bacterium]|nr:M20/M25/M40 family metallo-hydrolase [Planctomycetota bacterium]
MPGLDDFHETLLRDLVAIDTSNPPGNELAAAEFLAPVLERIGMTTTVQTVAPGRANLVATRCGGPGPEIVLSGHLDVVHADAARWSGDPFVLRRDTGRYYGRGVVDMKGAIASMVTAVRDFLQENGGAFTGTVSLVFVADEELTTLGTRGYIASGARPDAVVIGEPTGMDVCIAHRGTSRYRVDVRGQAGHAARPGEALNPITGAARLAVLVDEHNTTVLAARTHSVLPPPSMAVTMMTGGVQSNTIPGTCQLTIDRRTVPGEDEATLRSEFHDLAARLPDGSAAISVPEFFVTVPAGGPVPAGTIGQQCADVLAGMGVPVRIRDFPACCDLAFFTSAGIDCVLVGPGNLSEAHTDDEFVDETQLVLAREFYLGLLQSKLASNAYHHGSRTDPSTTGRRAPSTR